LARLAQNDFLYITPELIKQYDLYLSFTGGPTLDFIEMFYGAPSAKVLYCSFDPEHYFPQSLEKKWDLGYLGTYSDDRQGPLQALMLDVAKDFPLGKFVVAGPQYPQTINWPINVQRINHLPPEKHRRFYNSQRFTMNITRTDMVQAGYSPSVRLFEAAACGVPIISDYWEGISELFDLDTEILITRSKEDTLRYLQWIEEDQRLEIGQKARKKVLAAHTSAHRAKELESYLFELLGTRIPQKHR
jgi:spore maturation protein CgeB